MLTVLIVCLKKKKKKESPHFYITTSHQTTTEYYHLLDSAYEFILHTYPTHSVSLTIQNTFSFLLHVQEQDNRWAL